MNLSNLDSLAYLWPEMVLVAAIVVIFVADLFVRDKEILGNVALLGAALSCALAARAFSWDQGWLFNQMIVLDPFAVFFKLLFSLTAFLVIWMSMDSREVTTSQSQGEYYAILLSAVLGMYFMASASNLLMAYLSLEMVSIMSYVLTGYLRHDRRSGEAALKYLIYGAVASGTMIYGMSWIFGLAGSMDFSAINAALQGQGQNSLAIFIALTLILVGFGYKIAAVPFHMWAPDVYQGAPIPVTAFLSVASKAAGFALAIRFFYPGLSRLTGDGSWSLIPGVQWPQVIVVLSMITMTLGNLAALSQTNLKRLLAYSSIAHAGYTLMGFAVLSDDGLRAMLFYLVVYYLMNLGAFMVVMTVANSTGREDVDGFKGMAWRGGAVPAAAMTIFLFSLTGLPPFAGFIGKFYLFSAAIQKQFYPLAVVGAANSVIALYYYARIVKAMYLDMPEGEVATQEVALTWRSAAPLGVLSALTLVLGLYWAPLYEVVYNSVNFFVG
jgi:NADH-quinone oxidoreductase subunit N